MVGSEVVEFISFYCEHIILYIIYLYESIAMLKTTENAKHYMVL